MSREQEYSPPAGSKYEWGPKRLQHYPWMCNLSCQMAPMSQGRRLFLWPLSIDLIVSLAEGRFHWEVRIIDWHHQRKVKKGSCLNDLRALRTAERVGEEAFRALTPRWVMTALRHGWRSPT